METIGERIKSLETTRADYSRKADNLAPITARFLAKVADSAPSLQHKELGMPFADFVRTLKDSKGRPRNLPWARQLVQQWRTVEKYPLVAQACLDGEPMSKAILWVRVADVEGWMAEMSTGNSSSAREQTKNLVAARIVDHLKTRTWAEAEARLSSHVPTLDKVKMGGVVLRATKEGWTECWGRCATVLDRQVPKTPAFEWQVETVMAVANELLEAAERKGVKLNAGLD